MEDDEEVDLDMDTKGFSEVAGDIPLFTGIGDGVTDLGGVKYIDDNPAKGNRSDGGSAVGTDKDVLHNSIRFRMCS